MVKRSLERAGSFWRNRVKIKTKIIECYFEYIPGTAWDNPFEKEAYAINVNKQIEKEINKCQK